MNMKTQTQWSQVIRPAIVSIIVLTLIMGVIYPLLMTVISQAVFPYQANGSLIKDADDNIVGSELIGQQFSNPAYFWGRLSATGPIPYNAAASSGSNYGPLNPALIGPEGAVQSRITALKDADAAAGVSNDLPIPIDLVTASASGLDPHISPAAAEYQLQRVAALRGTDVATLQGLVDQFTTGRLLGLIGEPTVNVLELNLELDKQFPLTEMSSASTGG
jgi:K+-transporting ATPase ATPase C chain